MKKIIKYMGMLLIPFSLVIASCSSDDNDPVASGPVIIYDIKILNAGADGTETVLGTVNENEKTITFPELDKGTDLSALRFEAEMPEGASLDQEEYDFTMTEGKGEATRVIAVVNGKRKREYFATVQIPLDLPVWGADFSEDKMKVYDFSGRSTIYPDLSGTSTRSVDMDANHVLVVSRDATGPHLLKLEDLKKGEINPIKLDLTGVSGGTFPYSAGRLSNGHIYISNLATPPAAPFKIYHWASSDATPEVIASFTDADLPGYVGTERFGDYMSVDLDKNGNGYIFLGANPGQTDYNVLRLKVAGFTNISSPAHLKVATYGGYWSSFNKVDRSSTDYIYTGHQSAIMVVNENGQVQHTVSTSYTPITNADARIISFNKERYLIMMSTPGEGVVKLYDITEGDGTVEALSMLEEESRAPAVNYSFNGNIGAGTAVGSTGWAKDGDETLYIMGAAPGAGFVILEFPKKVKEEKED